MVSVKAKNMTQNFMGFHNHGFVPMLNYSKLGINFEEGALTLI
jgi:hypothetical protein